ncbi:hypothetical protein [Ottowia thiooxydans]|uniref:Uncharacterized protein n=1 Tax=Ottowia thiooxydans TaxID=219182 RepID=A0ABV2Q5J1_9BURK
MGRQREHAQECARGAMEQPTRDESPHPARVGIQATLDKRYKWPGNFPASPARGVERFTEPDAASPYEEAVGP